MLADHLHDCPAAVAKPEVNPHRASLRGRQTAGRLPAAYGGGGTLEVRRVAVEAESGLCGVGVELGKEEVEGGELVVDGREGDLTGLQNGGLESIGSRGEGIGEWNAPPSAL